MAEAQDAIMAGFLSRPVEWRRVRKAASWVEESRFSKIRENAKEISEAATRGWATGEARRLSRSAMETGVGGGGSGFDVAIMNVLEQDTRSCGSVTLLCENEIAGKES